MQLYINIKFVTKGPNWYWFRKKSGDNPAKRNLSTIQLSTWNVNSFRPTNAHMREQTRLSLLHIMDCCPFGITSLSEPMLAYYQPSTMEPRNLIQNVIFFIQENIFHNGPCKITTIFHRPRCANNVFIDKLRGHICFRGLSIEKNG